jgi:imidazolonepropionase-like amidohydrolase
MVILENCKVVDVREGRIKEVPVVIEKGRIISFESKKDKDCKRIDLDGAYILPGLINCHVHLSIVFPFSDIDPNESPAITALRCQRRGMDALKAGVTTVRTVGERYGADIHLRTMIEKGWVEGPRIISGGRSISVSGGHGNSVGTLLADGPEEFRKRAREELSTGADHLKVFISGGIANRSETFEECQMTEEEIAAVVEVARSKNTYVVAHSGGSENISKAVKLGVRCFEHGYVINYDTAGLMADNGCYLCPTLCVSRSPEWMEAHGFEPWTIEKATTAGADHLESIRIAIQAGVKIINGTDAPPGDSDRGINLTVKEIGHYVDAGLSNLAAIQASTLNCAELMGLAEEIGVVEPGYYADLVALRGNPLEDIQAFRGIFFVMQAGRVVPRDQA